LESYDIIREALDKAGTKTVAHEMNLSYSTVSKWGEIPPKEGEKGSGSRNPLDRVCALYNVTKHKPIIDWLCQSAGGYFVENPPFNNDKETAREYVAQTRDIVRRFYRLLEVVSESYENDGKIDDGESLNIRSEWENLKCVAGSFVNACEKGYYQ